MSTEQESGSSRPRVVFAAQAMKKTIEPDGTILIQAVDPSLVKPAPEHVAGFAGAKCLVTTDELGAFVCKKNGCTGLCFGPYEDENGTTYCKCG